MAVNTHHPDPHPEDDPEVVEDAADSLNEATLAIEGVDFNALTDDQLRALLDAKATLHDLTKELRRRQRSLGGGESA